MNRTNVSPKNVTCAEEDLQVAKLRCENNRTLSTQLAFYKAQKKLERLYKQVDPIALEAHRQMHAKMNGSIK